MLIPDNVHPEQTIYFNGGFVLKAISRHRKIDLIDLYVQTIAEQDMSIPVFILCLDWLFLLNLVELDEQGTVVSCF